MTKLGIEIFNDPVKFRNLMQNVDNKLKGSGFGIDKREWQAIIEISKRFTLSLPITKPLEQFKYEMDTEGMLKNLEMQVNTYNKKNIRLPILNLKEIYNLKDDFGYKYNRNEKLKFSN